MGRKLRRRCVAEFDGAFSCVAAVPLCLPNDRHRSQNTADAEALPPRVVAPYDPSGRKPASKRVYRTLTHGEAGFLHGFAHRRMRVNGAPEIFGAAAILHVS